MVGLDLSALMLGKARRRSPDSLLLIGDAQALPFADDSFDAAVLTLILSVVPDGAVCLRETVRVLRPGGRAVIFDKFLADGERPSRSRQLLNLLTSFFGTDITRRFDDMMIDSACTIEREEPSLLRGAYKIILVRKRTDRVGVV
jgi:ubiquinone/menaquinone biosynthesis C-methylase UbiE